MKNTRTEYGIDLGPHVWVPQQENIRTDLEAVEQLRADMLGQFLETDPGSVTVVKRTAITEYGEWKNLDE